jgi:cell division protein FtsB
MTTPMTTEEYKEWCVVHGEWPPAQEVLARLPAENKTLRVEVERLQDQSKRLETYLSLRRDDNLKLQTEIDRLRAENAKLRAALKAIYNEQIDTPESRIARRALEGSQ